MCVVQVLGLQCGMVVVVVRGAAAAGLKRNQLEQLLLTR